MLSKATKTAVILFVDGSFEFTESEAASSVYEFRERIK